MPSSDDQRVQALRERIAQFPKAPGVYLMKDREGRVLYVGKAKDLRSRVASYFQPSADLLNTRGPDICRMVANVADIDFLECETEVDALLKESRLIKDIQPPHNAQLKDDKTFPYLEITTGDDFPGVYLTRAPRLKGTKLYGPFLASAALRDAVNALQKAFKFRTCTLEIRADDESRRYFRPCLLHAINQCTAPCADLISKEDYRRDIARLRKLLASKRSVLIRQLTREMEQAAGEQRFEEAARLRDQIKSIESLSLSGDPQVDVQPEVFYVDPTEGLEKLGELLGLEAPPRSLEGIDIAHLQGQETVGALVCFLDGRPFKSGYRRFQIRTVEGVDDYAAIREVVLRRYRYAAEGEELYPDVILIDGGLGQLHAAQEAFELMNVRPPMVISLAKREEELFIQARSSPVRLARNDAALRLLQQVRDEAHRFAQHYHHLLRSRKLFDEQVEQGRRVPRHKKAGPAAPEST
ncbi:MAG TPA: excinuclease ABC subunit UvrC [Phycisphaerae bacterium]|nr:excinuclease ABC subunit UvrC [Phycisphaerae bacterium]HNU43685.1 excinuclease ABC subunit UvrC [Phycisphaerae bacterium]